MNNTSAYVTINQAEQVAIKHQQTSLAQVVDTLNIDTNSVAIAVNNSIVPNKQWPTYQLATSDNINIFTAIAGG